MRKNSITRRDFMRLGMGTTLLGAAGRVTCLEPALLAGSPRAVPPSDTVRFASIGTGVRGCEVLRATRVVPGVECVASCDVYDTRRISVREALGDKDVPATRDYRQILDRQDIDAVIIAAPDHQHRPIAVAACEAGKDVYCEKPMGPWSQFDLSKRFYEETNKLNRVVHLLIIPIRLLAHWQREQSN